MDDITKILDSLKTFTDANTNLEDPAVPAALRALSLLEAATDMREQGKGRYYVREALDTLVPRQIREWLPRSDPQYLLIMTWTARRAKGTDVMPGEVVWVNMSLRSLLETMTANECKSISICNLADECRHNGSCSLKIFLDQYSGKKSPTELTLEEFLLDLGCPVDRDAIDQFYGAIANAPKMALAKAADLTAFRTYIFTRDGMEKTQGGTSDIPSQSKDNAEIFIKRIQLGEKVRWIVGARTLSVAGVHLRVRKDEAASYDNSPASVDMIAVWQVEDVKEGDDLTANSFVAVQGAFVPADGREREHKDHLIKTRKHQVAATAARNMSHSLGSHALNHISTNLAASDDSEKRKVAQFLAYVQQRASLIAMLATGIDWPFSVSLPLKLIIRDFNQQALLKESLCKTENCELGNFEVGTTPNGLSVDLPGGLSGSQAVFAIFENFARNSAKHSLRMSAEDNKVSITGYAEVVDDNLVRCTIWDKKAKPILDEHLRDFQSCLQDESAGTDAAGLGVDEMKIWAGYLRGTSDIALVRGAAGTDDEPPLLEAGRSEDGQLSLTFYFRRSDFLSQGEDETHSQFKLYRSESSRPEEPSGRWIKTSQSNGDHHIETRFKRISSDDSYWNNLRIENLKDEELILTVQAAYVETLRQYAYGGNPARELALVIVDGPMLETIRNSDLCYKRAKWYCEIKLPFVGIRAIVSDELLVKKKLFGKNDKERIDLSTLREEFVHNDLAIWDRHRSSMREEAMKDENAGVLLHYECYDVDSNPYRLILKGIGGRGFDVAFLFGRLAEAALLKGAIFDERFAEMYPENSIPRRLSALAGIKLLDPRLERDRHLATLVHDSDGVGPGQTLNRAFISVHASLSRNKLLPYGSQNEWADFMKHMEQYPLVTLHSGGGGWEKLDPRNPFYPETIFRDWAFSSVCKLCLTEALLRGGRRP